MVEETFEPGMTVSLLARRHGVAPNQAGAHRERVREMSDVNTVECKRRNHATTSPGDLSPPTHNREPSVAKIDPL
jgi:transposase-like protein